MKSIYTFLRWFVGGIAILLLVLVGYLYISGNTYMFFLLKHTVLEGRLGPSIDEYEIYSNRAVETGDYQAWPVQYNGAQFTRADSAYNANNETIAFLVALRDTIVFEYYAPGYSDSSYTNSWSMAKSIIGLLVGCAIEDGLIDSLDAPVAKYYPPYEGSDVTIRHLLMMSSGINFDEHYLNPFSYAARGLYDDDFEKLHERYKPVEKPGVFFDYQSGNSQLLGMILAKVTQKSVAEYAAEKLWKPIGAQYPAWWSLDHEDGMEKCFCCFNSNARDFARLGKLVAHAGVWEGDTLVPPDYVRLATKPAPLKQRDGSEYRSYGLQWWTLDLPKVQGCYARGIQGQYIFVFPEEELIIVRLGRKREQIEDSGHITDVFNYIDMGKRLAKASNRD